jgi:hypothetical protein
MQALATDGTSSERVGAANSAILAEVARRPELAGMGTTITMVELGDDRWAPSPTSETAAPTSCGMALFGN